MQDTDGVGPGRSPATLDVRLGDRLSDGDPPPFPVQRRCRRCVASLCTRHGSGRFLPAFTAPRRGSAQCRGACLRWRGESALSMGLTQGTIGTRDPARAPGAVRTDTVAVPRVDLQALGLTCGASSPTCSATSCSYCPGTPPTRGATGIIRTGSLPRASQRRRCRSSGRTDFARPRGRRAARPVDHGVRRGRNQYQLVGPWQL